MTACLLLATQVTFSRQFYEELLERSMLKVAWMIAGMALKGLLS